MKRALFLADKAEQEGEVPVGAVIVQGNQLIAEGWNQSIQLNDPTAHAEIQAMRQAGTKLQNYRLNDLRLYVTLEPCAMCAMAMVHARIQTLVYGAKDPKTGAVESIMNLVQDERLNHQIDVIAGEMEHECSQKLSAFFKAKRSK